MGLSVFRVRLSVLRKTQSVLGVQLRESSAMRPVVPVRGEEDPLRQREEREAHG
jgi:hypothetical protein